VKILRKIITVLILVAFASTLILMIPNQTKALDPTSTISIINPGPTSNPTKWNASAPLPEEIGGGNFTFYTNQTTVGSTFFINVTISNLTACKGWGIGVVWDNTTLDFVSAWLPSDHPFAPMMITSVPVPQVVDDVDATHKIFKWGFGYVMPTPAWTFNGTGTICQIQFRIIKAVSGTHPVWSTSLTFDPDWTTVYFHPGPPKYETPTMESGYVSYIFDNTVPQIDKPTQSPPSSNVQPNQAVLVSVNVTDPDGGGLRNVTLYYTNDTTWNSLPMTLNSTNQLWQATIPGYPAGTNVKYKIEAYDKAGNSAVNDNNSVYFAYNVVPEFTAIALLLMFAFASLVIVVAKNRNKKAVAT
jgi:hypothetical protein